jgi:hypothetical protein
LPSIPSRSTPLAQQRLAGRRPELRVGAQEFEEGDEVAGVVEVTKDRCHLGADAAHFANAGLVHALGRGIRKRREIAHEVGVIVAAIGERCRAGRRSCGGPVFVFEKALEASVGRNHRVRERRPAGGGEARPVRVGNRMREIRERLP